MIVAAHIRMMDQLLAEEASMLVHTSAASRFLKGGEWVKRFVSRLARAASGPRKKQPRRSDMTSVGIGVKHAS